ncbi:MAG: triose-phosphate isomerase [Acidobacteriota bacterium]
MRRPIIAGNWKLYKTPSEATAFQRQFAPLVQNATHVDIVVCPSFLSLPAAMAAKGSNVECGAQDLFWASQGAFTGEVSGPMLASIGCEWVIIGHSERRQYFGETDESVALKVEAALEAGLKPIVCIGELLDEREAGQTDAALAVQFIGGLSMLTPEQFSRIVIAYEPVWAIGTGLTATPAMAAAAHSFIRGQIEAHYGSEAAQACRILYGGSVKPDNIKALMDEEDLDGALVGGASLDPVSFAAIVNYQR